MQNTSALYQTIIAGDHWFETKISIAGNEITESGLFSVSRTRNGMNGNKPSVGGAIISTLDLKILTPSFTIPKRATIIVYCRAKNASQTSEWISCGTYFVDTRKYSKSSSLVETMEITACDAMAKAEADYPNTSHNWPYLDKNVVAEIASTIGVTVDSRTNQFLTSGYMIGLPVGYTMRETLEHIAGAYGGNFVITSENKLLFVPLYGFDLAETGNYLADESGNALVFGNEGWYILV